MRTAAGRDHQARTSFDTASNATATYASARYIAVTENATAPADADTALTGELTLSGFGRATAVYAHTLGATTTTLTITMTSSDATTRTLQKLAIFNATSAGTMAYSTAIPSPPTLVSGDAVTFTSTITM